MMKCEVCGKDIQTVEVLGLKIEKACECQREATAKKEQEYSIIGQEVVKTYLQEQSELPKRYRQASYNTLKRIEGQRNAIKALTEFNGETGIILTGTVGSGKTHLSSAFVNKAIEEQVIPKDTLVDIGKLGYIYNKTLVRTKVKFISLAGFLSNIRKLYEEKIPSQEYINIYKQIPILVLDDVGAEKVTDWTQERLFELVDYRYGEMLPIIATTNLGLAELKKAVGERVYDRLREMSVMAAVTSGSQR